MTSSGIGCTAHQMHIQSNIYTQVAGRTRIRILSIAIHPQSVGEQGT